jgi:hypothetical protein
MPMSPSSIVPVLAMAGLGLGIFVPANNAVIMRTAEPGSADRAHEMGPSGAFG